jgi:hypothetical protein
MSVNSTSRWFKRVWDRAVADGQVPGDAVDDLSITAAKLATNAVETAKINALAVTADKLAADSVVEAKIADDAVTEDKIADDSVTTAKIDDGAVTPDKLHGTAKSIGFSEDYDKETDGVIVHIDANDEGDGDRVVTIVTEVTEIFADGDGAQPTFKIGQTGEAEDFAADTEFTGASAGAKEVFHGVLTAENDLIITATEGTGTATGALKITVIAVPLVEPAGE